MPSLPQAAFAVHKIREHRNQEQKVAVMKKADDKKRSSTPRYDNPKCTY